MIGIVCEWVRFFQKLLGANCGGRLQRAMGASRMNSIK